MINDSRFARHQRQRSSDVIAVRQISIDRNYRVTISMTIGVAIGLTIRLQSLRS
jgi:hypothetical protein